MSKNTFRVKALIAASCLSSLAYADISGIVYTDFNLDGIKNNNDILLSGVAIHAVCEDGSTYEATTNENGLYTLENTPSGEYCRVEADPSVHALSSSSNDAGSAPLVDRVTDGTTDHDISVSSTATYCQENPNILAVSMPTIADDGSTTHYPESHPTLIKTLHPSEGSNNGQNTIDTNRKILTLFSDTGATWGLAYKKDTNDTFMAASLKPYANLGAHGIGAIYKIAEDNTISPFVTIPNASSNALNDYLSIRDVDFDDEDVYPFIAREGLGDIEISENYQTLYVLNMHQKSIVEVDATSGNIIKTTFIPNPYNGTCPDTDVRPWALTVKGNDVYIGSLCESKISASDGGLGASIQKYNGSIIQEVARTNTLDYLKPYYQAPTREALGRFNHKSWQEDKTSPILTDIEMAYNGDLILGYTNRLSFMRHGNNKLSILGGDIRKMCHNNNGTYTDESTAEAPTSCTSHQVTYANNTDIYYEFYKGDFFGTLYGENGHPETMSGALVQEPGKSYITASVIDGTSLEGPGAIAQFSHTSGEKIGVQALIKSLDNDIAEAEVFGRKSGGLGDIELMCDPAPIEIGNYIWLDLDEDGIQDPEETPLSDINVELYDGTTLIGETVTDATGHYYFGGLSDANLDQNIHLTSYHTYTIKVKRDQDNITIATLKDVNGNNDDIRDSDARTEASYLVIDVTTNVNNDHTLDIGVIPVKIGNLVWIEDDYDGDATTGHITPVVGTTVTATCNTIEYTAVTDSTGHYIISVPANVNCTVKVSTPATTIPTKNSDDNSVPDTTSEENKTHDGLGTTVSVIKTDNMTLDFGFIIATPEITIEKATNTIDADTSGEAVELTYGDTVTWSYIITNIGNEPLKNIIVNDDKEGAIECPSTTLDIGSSMVCTPKSGTATKLTYENKARVSAKGTLSNKNTHDDDLSHYKLLEVKIGNRVWIETDNDGDATTGHITPVVGTTVRATCNGINYTTNTDTNGLYSITVPANIGICTLKVTTPSGTTPTQGSHDNSVNDTTSEENKTHNGSATTVTVGIIDNMTLDFGFYKNPDKFDLALIQKVSASTPDPYIVGEDVTFKITVCNQGTLNASNIQINDYIPSGLKLNDSDWKTSGNIATLKNPIASLTKGTCTTRDITFTIQSSAACKRIVNNAEICSANGGTDIDSIPCSENGTTPDPLDNDMADTSGGDDYDPANIRVACTPTAAPTPTPKPGIAPAKPENLEVIISSDNMVTLVWGDNSSNESGFKIYQNGKLIAIVPANSTNYILKDLKARETYTYTVKSFNDSKESKGSNTIKFTAQDDYTWLIATVYYIQL